VRLLLAEDQPVTAEHLVQGLQANGFAVDVARDGDEALSLAGQSRYDALLMDVMLPAMDGISVVRQLRRNGNQTPVVFLTGRADIEDRVRGLDAGGDDYLPKPFHLDELLARLRAILRRQRSDTALLLRVADLELDLISRVARRAGREIQLTSREFALLELLMTHSPRPVSRPDIVKKVWDQHFDSGTNVINVYVNKLRRKLDLPGTAPLLHTVRGTGFAFHADTRKAQ
jgi:DNA-binding response OmpR family regulator